MNCLIMLLLLGIRIQISSDTSTEKFFSLNMKCRPASRLIIVIVTNAWQLKPSIRPKKNDYVDLVPRLIREDQVSW